jgi:hypothetical protein
MNKSKEDIQSYIEQLQKQGVKANTSAPPLFRLMWSLGVGVRPPLNQSFLMNTLFMGLYFGIFWGLFMWLFQWRKWHLSAFSAVMFAAGAGLLFGVTMATYYRWKSRRVNVPTW